MIIRTRQRLIRAAKDLRDHGIVPRAALRPELYRVRSGGVVLPRDVDWLEATAELRRPDREIEEALAMGR
jgi:phthalate 4,5-dioxygenase oxygenase subunit